MNSLNSNPSSHRWGMTVLFSTELWERFSFYGMKALLVPFLMQAFQYEAAQAKEMLGTYILLVYLSPLFAGIICDRFLNLRMSIYVGALVMALGHFAMAFKEATFIGMALIIAGNGFFKPCATNMVGALYPENHPWRSSAYSMFYFGINLGAFISPFACGWLREHYGFDWGFVVAGVGMLISLLTFLCFEQKLGVAGLRESEKALLQGRGGRMPVERWGGVLFVSLVTSVIVVALALSGSVLSVVWTPTWILGEKPSPTILFLTRMAVILVLLFIYTKLVPKSAESRPLTYQEKDRIWVVGAVSLSMFLLVIALEQAGGTLNLFAKDKTQPDILGIAIPYEFYQAVNPLWVMALTLVGAWLWSKLDARGISDLHKLGPGLLLVSVAFFLLRGAEAVTANGDKASPLWLIGIYGFIAAGEVCISVIGLSAVNKLAPKHMQAFFTALFFLSIAVGGYLAGTVEEILKELGVEPWLTLGLVCVGFSVVAMAGANSLRRRSHGIL